MNDPHARSEIRRRRAEIQAALEQADFNPVLKRVYANREVASPDDVTYSVEKILGYRELRGIEAAARLVADAVERSDSIVIVGDYDADGATSTALVMRALAAFGAARAAFLVPDRFRYGYGLTPPIVELAQPYEPSLLITVDNGISSLAGVEAAKAAGMKVVITDHHLAGYELPDADAIVNPNQPGCPFPSKAIAGVGVAFYLMLAVRAELRQRGRFSGERREPNMAELLDLVALGTVADVVPLDRNNRALVDLGLRRMRRGAACEGIQALFRVANRDIRRCASMDLGFFVGPRLNAAGRLENMATGIECLLTDDAHAAEQLAGALHRLNHERRAIEKRMLNEAMTDMQAVVRQLDGRTLAAALCLYQPDWHQGIVGLLASRIKERYHRPVIAFADADPDDETGSDELKGSARSIPGLHIRDILDAVATRHPGLISKFGGHAMAAGLSIARERVEDFRAAFVEQVEHCVTQDMLQKVVDSDGAIGPDEMTIETAEALEAGGPWGQQFPEPVFDDVFEIVNWKVVGENHLKMQVRHGNGERAIDAIAFNHPAASLPPGNHAHIAYRMNVNEYRNARSLQLVVEYIAEAQP